MLQLIWVSNNLSLVYEYTEAAIGMIVSDECVCTPRLLSDQFTTKKGEGKLLRSVAFCSLSCIMVQFGFLQQFRNENCSFHNDIRVKFFPIFFFFRKCTAY